MSPVAILLFVRTIGNSLKALSTVSWVVGSANAGSVFSKAHQKARIFVAESALDRVRRILKGISVSISFAASVNIPNVKCVLRMSSELNICSTVGLVGGLEADSGSEGDDGTLWVDIPFLFGAEATFPCAFN